MHGVFHGIHAIVSSPRDCRTLIVGESLLGTHINSGKCENATWSRDGIIPVHQLRVFHTTKWYFIIILINIIFLVIIMLQGWQ